MVVAAHPGPEITVEPELDLVKAALLYGSEVILLSPVTTMFLAVEEWGHFSIDEQIGLIRRLAPYLIDDPEKVPAFEQGIDRVVPLLKAKGGGFQATMRRRVAREKLRPAMDGVTEAVGLLSGQASMEKLKRARAEGLLKIESANPADASELIADCVISAKLREAGSDRDSELIGRMVATFVSALAAHLSAGRDYLIIDESVASLTRAGIEAGLFTPGSGAAGRSAQAMTASGLMARLPTFPEATVDEILDIREELADPLGHFRGAMVSIAKTFSKQPWETDFEDCVHDAWVETVYPALLEIKAAIEERRSLLSMAADVAGAAKSGLPGVGIVAAGMAGHAEAVTVAGGAASAGATLLEALRSRTTSAARIKMQPFYFLYGLNQSLPGR